MDNSESAVHSSGSLVSQVLHHLSGVNVATCTDVLVSQGRGRRSDAHPKHMDSCEDMLPI